MHESEHAEQAGATAASRHRQLPPLMEAPSAALSLAAKMGNRAFTRHVVGTPTQRSAERPPAWPIGMPIQRSGEGTRSAGGPLSWLWQWMKRSGNLLRGAAFGAALANSVGEGGQAVKVPGETSEQVGSRKEAEERHQQKGKEKKQAAGSDPPKGRGHGTRGGSKAARLLKNISKGGRIAGAAGSIMGSSSDVIQIIAQDYPQRLPEGAKVELMRPKKDLPLLREPSGYTVEKQDGKVIYRGPDGGRVTKDEATHAINPMYAGEA